MFDLVMHSSRPRTLQCKLDRVKTGSHRGECPSRSCRFHTRDRENYNYSNCQSLRGIQHLKDITISRYCSFPDNPVRKGHISGSRLCRCWCRERLVPNRSIPGPLRNRRKLKTPDMIEDQLRKLLVEAHGGCIGSKNILPKPSTKPHQLFGGGKGAPPWRMSSSFGMPLSPGASVGRSDMPTCAMRPVGVGSGPDHGVARTRWLIAAVAPTVRT